ncbi:MAG: glutathione S-transferase family protein [Aeromonadaceae bacterium]|nr:glutathione S-transferase family protein [Aeromonadaceae bacterium]
MSALQLLIANKNYSSWSLRGWLVVKHSGLPFQERSFDLGDPAFKAQIALFSPTGRVPVLLTAEGTVWDSLAIAEFLAESVPELWPIEPFARAQARSISAEMHSGFMSLRQAMPMNLRAEGRQVAMNPVLAADIERIVAIWCECRERYQDAGPWLFGQWSIADAMYAPVASRFRTYGVPLPEVAQEYVTTVFADPALQEWLLAARSEGELARSEVGLSPRGNI